MDNNELKKELREVCERVLSYQKSIADIDKYIQRINEHIKVMNSSLDITKIEETFGDYEYRLNSIQQQLDSMKLVHDAVVDGGKELRDKLKVLSYFDAGLKGFEKAVDEFKPTATLLTKSINSKEFKGFTKAATTEIIMANDHHKIMMERMERLEKMTEENNAMNRLIMEKLGIEWNGQEAAAEQKTENKPEEPVKTAEKKEYVDKSKAPAKGRRNTKAKGAVK